MIRKTTIILAAIAVAAHLESGPDLRVVSADNSTYRVYVAPFMNIFSPVSSRTITHNETDNDQTFPTTMWWAIGTSRFGHTVTLATTQAFTHTVYSSHKRDVKLQLFRIAGSNNWTIDTPTDTTDYDAVIPDEIATVQASSSGPTLGIFRLRTTFITDDFATLPHGDYETTVVGTISANY